MRALLILCITTAFSGAMVFVNTVVIVQGGLSMADQGTAVALAAFGFGSMGAAIAMPRLLLSSDERKVMLGGVSILIVVQLWAALMDSYTELLMTWLMLGCGYSLVQTPASKILVSSASSADRPALFAAHFALSHAGWMVAYPFAGWLLTTLDLSQTFMALAATSFIGLMLSIKLWPGR